MIFPFVFVILMALGGTIGKDYYTAEQEQYVLSGLNAVFNPIVGPLAFDGPAYVSNAPTPLNTNVLPTTNLLNYYMYYAAATYYGYELANLSCKYCLKFRCDVSDHEVLPNDDQDTLALVTVSEKREEIVVAFRGTWNVWNNVLDCVWISGSYNDENIKIHRGYYIATMSLYNDVVLLIAKYLNQFPGYRVILTGHSLGGSVACLTYFFLKDTNQFPTVTYELYTYGEPREGNKYFADFINSQTTKTARVTARADLFPHLPPTSIAGTTLLGSFYVHAQTEVWIRGRNNITFCSRTIAEDPACSMSMGPIYSLADHLEYFDVNLASVIGQPLIFAYLPLGLLDPVEDIPPLPKAIQNLIGDEIEGVYGTILPPLG